MGLRATRATNQAFLHVRADKVTHMIDWPEFEDAPEFGKIALSGHWESAVTFCLAQAFGSTGGSIR